MRVRISTEARADLRRLVTAIARDNPRAAQRMRDIILRRIASLYDYPERGPVFRGMGSAPLRYSLVSAYLILYAIRDETVSITRVLHGARDLDAELGTSDGGPEEAP